MNNSMLPRPEYPRPQLARDNWINLNGEWEFERDRAVSGKARRLYRADHLTEKIIVPFCMESKISGIEDKDFCECVWYRREVEIPSYWLENNKRVILNFGACDYKTTLYVNGSEIGYHFGGMVSFSFDITKRLIAGKNVITVCAEDYRRSGNQPSGKQSDRYESYGCFYTRTTGIWQTVWLESVPETYIKSLHIYPNVEDLSVSVCAYIEGKPETDVSFKTLFNNIEVGSAQAKVGGGMLIANIKLSELHLWELGEGKLYDLVITCGYDTVKSYFGMRSLSVGENGVLVINGKKVFQRLVLDQGFYPDGIWTAPSDAELENDIKRSMALGFNGARLHQKVFEERFLYHCDRYGYIVWGEHGNWGLNLASPVAWKGYFHEWREIVQRDANHPAVIGWCPLNETKKEQDPDFVKALVELTKSIDPTRPVIDSSGWTHEKNCTDIIDWHDYDQNPETLKKRYEDVADGISFIENRRFLREKIAPNFISEYGGIKWDINSNLENAWGYGNAPQSEEEFLARFKGLTEALMFNPFITGICYTQLTDIEQETNGLYTYDRQAKFDVNFFKEVLTQKAACEV